MPKLQTAKKSKLKNQNLKLKINQRSLEREREREAYSLVRSDKPSTTTNHDKARMNLTSEEALEKQGTEEWMRRSES